MKKIKLLISLLIINFSVYSQNIPTAKQFLNFLKENNYTCNSIDYEEVYSNYGYDVEDDVSQLIDAIGSYCKYLIPNYFEEFQKIETANDNLIKTLKSKDFKYLNYTSLLAFTIFQDISVVPNEVKIEVADNTRPPYSAFYDGFIGKIPGDNNSYNGILGDKYPGFSFIQTSHDFSKKLDEFEVGDKSRVLAFIDSNDELIKQIIYNIYFEKVDDDRVWKISDVEKEITCRFGKDKFGKCVDKVDKSINTIIEYIGSWDRKISKEKIDWDWATWGLNSGFRSKYLIANAVFNENLIIFLERIFDSKVFLSGPHEKGMNFNSSNEFGRYNPEFIKKLITSAEEILSNPFYLNLIRPIYKNHLEDMVITYQATSELFKIHKEYFGQYLNEAKKIYLISLETGNQDLLPKDNFAVQTVFGDWTFESDVSEEAGIEIPDYDYDKLNYYNYYTALNFWGRRNIDGTDKLFSELLELVIEKISDDKVDISNATIKEDKVDISGRKFKRGQYKVFLKEIDEQAASGAQNKNDYVNITEIILNISDDINGIYSYTSWGYDSQSCEFSSGEIKNENTIGFTLECLSEGNKYDAGSYTIGIIDEGTLRWKSDDGSFEKVFNYTFIPIE